VTGCAIRSTASVNTGRLIAGSAFSHRIPPTQKAPRPARYTGRWRIGASPTSAERTASTPTSVVSSSTMISFPARESGQRA
jgi:hypothetical protein